MLKIPAESMAHVGRQKVVRVAGGNSIPKDLSLHGRMIWRVASVVSPIVMTVASPWKEQP